MTKIKLMIHAEDGSFPHLSEYLLRTYFNPKDETIKDHLILGIAVKDTCIQPIYTAKESKKKRKRQESDGEEKKTAPKPTGYTYDTVTLHEQTRLMEGYNTFAVPSFDLVDDAKVQMEKDAANRLKNSQKNSTKEGQKSIASVTSTKNHLSLITPNGLQQITPELYTQVGSKLECDHLLALFDQANLEEGKKRKAAACERSKAWLGLCQKTHQTTTECTSKLWAAFSCHDSKWTLNDSIQYITEYKELLQGIALVGLHHVQSREERKDLVKKISSSFNPTPALAMLAVPDLSQLFDAVECGTEIISTSLPVTWARSNRLFNVLTVKSEEAGSDGCIDLSDEKYARDTSPLLEGCQCLSCKDSRYNKAYVHHLIKANELLAQILLFGHNLYQLLVLFKEELSSDDLDLSKVRALYE